MKRLALALALTFAAAGLAAPVAATPGNPHKTTVCHRTASDSNPYVLITVDVASLPAHLNNLPGHPEKHGRNDFLPFANGRCYQDPGQPVSDFTATGWLAGPCADPRVRAHMDNTASDTTAVYRIKYRDGRNIRKTFRKEVGPGEYRKSFWLWVYGQGQVVRLVVWEKGNRLATRRVLDRVTIKGNALPWGTKDCIR